MKYLILLSMMLLSVETYADFIPRHTFVGVKRKLPLKKIGASGAAYVAYSRIRIERHGGKTYDKPTIVFKDIFEADTADRSSRFNVLFGYKTKGLPIATGSIRSFRFKPSNSIAFNFNGHKRELFKKIFREVKKNQTALNGEIRIEVNTSSLYFINCRVHLITK